MGAICKACTNKRCVDIGTDAEPLEIECPQCNGNGCDECGAMGVFRIDGCPNDYCRPVAHFARLADLFDKGLPPVAGGALDQAAWFLSAVQFLASDEAEMRGGGNGRR